MCQGPLEDGVPERHLSFLTFLISSAMSGQDAQEVEESSALWKERAGIRTDTAICSGQEAEIFCSVVSD